MKKLLNLCFVAVLIFYCKNAYSITLQAFKDVAAPLLTNQKETISNEIKNINQLEPQNNTLTPISNTQDKTNIINELNSKPQSNNQAQENTPKENAPNQLTNPLKINEEENKIKIKSTIRTENTQNEQSSYEKPATLHYVSQDRRYKGVKKIPHHESEVANQNHITKNIQEEVNGNLNKAEISKNVEELQTGQKFNKLFNSQLKSTPTQTPTPTPTPAPTPPSIVQIQKSGSYIIGGINDTLIFTYNNMAALFSTFGVSLNRVISLGSYANFNNQLNLVYQNSAFTQGYNINGTTLVNGVNQPIISMAFNNPSGIATVDSPFNLTNWLQTTNFVPGYTGNSMNETSNNIQGNFNLSTVISNAQNPNATTTTYTVNMANLMVFILDIGSKQGIESLINNLTFFVTTKTPNNNILNFDPNGPMGQIMALIQYILTVNYSGSVTNQFSFQGAIQQDKDQYVNTLSYVFQQKTADITGTSYTNMSSSVVGEALVSQTYPLANLQNGFSQYKGDSVTGYSQYVDIVKDLAGQNSLNISNGIYNVTGNTDLSFTFSGNNVTNFSGSLAIAINDTNNTTFNFQMVLDNYTNYQINGHLLGTGSTVLLNLPGFNQFNITNASPNGSEMILSGTFAAQRADTQVQAVGSFTEVINLK